MEPSCGLLRRQPEVRLFAAFALSAAFDDQPVGGQVFEDAASRHRRQADLFG